MKEIIKAATEHYAWCIENLPKENPLEFCKGNFIANGICYFVYKKYNILIELKEYTKGRAYLCITPNHSTTFEEILISLRTRHKRLLEMSEYTG